MKIEDKRDKIPVLGELCLGDTCIIRGGLCVISNALKNGGIEVFNLNISAMQTFSSDEQAQLVNAKIVLED